SASTANRIAGPRLVVLGTVQDGGLPQAGCNCRNCEAARNRADRRRYVASAAIVAPSGNGSDSVCLVDASPDLRPQLDLLGRYRHSNSSALARRPVEGVLLTHAHIGHYLGLAQFGFEAVNTHSMPIYSTSRMADFLRANGPWSMLVQRSNIDLKVFEPGKEFA